MPRYLGGRGHLLREEGIRYYLIVYLELKLTLPYW